MTAFETISVIGPPSPPAISITAAPITCPAASAPCSSGCPPGNFASTSRETRFRIAAANGDSTLPNLA